MVYKAGDNIFNINEWVILDINKFNIRNEISQIKFCLVLINVQLLSVINCAKIRNFRVNFIVYK